MTTSESPEPDRQDPAVTATEWLAAFSSELGVPAPDEATVTTLLELAGVAAHSSERIAAPIACYLLGTRAMSPDDGLELSKRVSQGLGA